MEDLQSSDSQKKPKELTEEEKKALEEQGKKDKELVDFSDMKPGEYFLHIYVEETIQITNPTDSEKTQDLILKGKFFFSKKSKRIRTNKIEQSSGKSRPRRQILGRTLLHH